MDIKRLVDNENYFWEVVEITETRVYSYDTKLVTSNAPPLYQLARCAE